MPKLHCTPTSRLSSSRTPPWQADEYEGMAAAQQKAIAESERITTAKESKAAENAKAKADAEENLEGTKAALDADTKSPPYIMVHHLMVRCI